MAKNVWGQKNQKKLHGHSEPKTQTDSFEVGDFSDHKGKTPSPPKANSFIARACFRPCFFDGEAAGVDGWRHGFVAWKTVRFSVRIVSWAFGCGVNRTLRCPDLLKSPSPYSLRDFHQKGTLWRKRKSQNAAKLEFVLEDDFVTDWDVMEFITMADHLGEDFWFSHVAGFRVSNEKRAPGCLGFCWGWYYHFWLGCSISHYRNSLLSQYNSKEYGFFL